MRFCIIILLSLLLSKTAHAKNYFDFNSASYLLSKDGIVDIKVTEKLDNYNLNNFVIRPVVSKGTAYYYNYAREVWTGIYDLWTNMPSLDQPLKLKIVTDSTIDLSFKIQNIQNGEIYETKPKKYYSYNKVLYYLKKLKLN